MAKRKSFTVGVLVAAGVFQGFAAMALGGRPQPRLSGRTSLKAAPLWLTACDALVAGVNDWGRARPPGKESARL